MYKKPSSYNSMNNTDNMEYNCPYPSYKPMQQQYNYNDAGNSAGSMNNGSMNQGTYTKFKDYGPKPFVVNIEEATKLNNTFRTALWTGEHLQLTLMSINVGEDIGLEIHPNIDQFIRIEEGYARVMMGDNKDKPNFKANVKDGFAIFIPAGTWHNIVNTGKIPLKLYSIYAPPKHPFGTVQVTKADAHKK